MEDDSLLIPEKFDLSVRPMVQGLLNQTLNFSCEYNFVNLYCWESIYQYTWFLYEGRLVVHDGVDHILFMPLGPTLNPESIHALSLRALEMGLSPDICLVPQNYVTQFPELERFYAITRDRNAAEYIYRADHLAELKGKRLHKKKNLIYQFKSKYPDYRILPLTGKNLTAVREFARDLLEVADPVPQTLEEEFSAMEKAFDHWDELGLRGIEVVVENKIAAFSVFSQMSPDIANVHFEKSNLAFKGAAQIINQETAQSLKEKVRFINREQDLGIPGLRQAKLSYEPDHLITPFVLRFKKLS